MGRVIKCTILNVIDIVQAAGRDLRPSKNTWKTKGYICLPLRVPSGKDLHEFAKETAFKTLVKQITSLSLRDDRITEELSLIFSGKNRKNKLSSVHWNVYL